MISRKLKKEGLVVSNENPLKIILKSIYDSAAPQDIPYEQAVEILGDQNKWKKLNKGQKLNVIKAYSLGISKVLDIKPVPIRLAHFRFFHPVGWALSTEHGVVMNASRIKQAIKVSAYLAHEMKHMQQFYAAEGEHVPKTLSAQEVEEFRRSIKKRPSGIMSSAEERIYHDRIIEVDARAFALSHEKATFYGPEGACVPEKRISKAFQRKTIRRALLEVGIAKIITCTLDEEGRAEIRGEAKNETISELSYGNPYLRSHLEGRLQGCKPKPRNIS